MITDHWIDPKYSYGLMDYYVNFVHEARHNQDKLHDCPVVIDGQTRIFNDQTLSEMGAWAVQYYLYNWLADYSDPAFFSDSRYIPVLKHDADFVRTSKICDQTK